MRISDWSSDVCSSDLRRRKAMFSAMSAPKLWGCHQRWKTDPEIAACRIARQIRLSLISSSDFRTGLYGRRKRLERTFINGSPLQGSQEVPPARRRMVRSEELIGGKKGCR